MFGTTFVRVRNKIEQRNSAPGFAVVRSPGWGDDLTKQQFGPAACGSTQPASVSTPAEFTAALRTLREWSGLTYRQLEDKATALGTPLPVSTIASTSGRTTLPRERFIDSFTPRVRPG
ncbi:helix-turn-helix domain-containing protein [Actinophytocola sediminis]